MPPLPPRDALRLRHMLEPAAKAVAYTRERDRTILDVEEMRALAVIRLLEIVGEAARAVTDSTRAQFPEVPLEADRRDSRSADPRIRGCRPGCRLGHRDR